MEEKEPLNLIFTNAVNFNLYTKAFNQLAMSVGNPRQPQILDSSPWTLDSKYWISDSN